MPVRVQLSRKRGWRMPPNTVKVARPSRWGNPFKVACLYDYRSRGRGASWGVLQAFQAGDTDTTLLGFSETHKDVAEARGRAVRLYREAIESKRLKLDVAQLRGRNLACFCPLDQPCHADVLLVLANGPLCEAVP